ncbi:MAG: two-component regulator propeller domain-containing protein [Bacteroidales bacterium]
MARNQVRNIFFYCILSVLTLYGLGSFAQDLPYNRFSIKDGLPNNQIFALDEDAQGFLWVGTYEGLFRFDGHNFEDFSKLSPILQNRVAGITACNDSLFVTSSLGITIMHNGKVDNHPFLEYLRNGFVFVNKVVTHKNKIYIEINYQEPVVFDIRTAKYYENKLTFNKSIDSSKIKSWTIYESRNDSLLTRVYSSDDIRKLHRQLRNDEEYYRKNNNDQSEKQGIAKYKKKIADLSREIILYHPQSTTNIMDYSASKNNWFSWQWEILRAELIEKNVKQQKS